MDYLKDLLEEMQENPFKWTSAYSALNDYIEHNDKTALIDAIRNKPEIMEYQTVRNFIADVMEGKKIRKGGFTHKDKAKVLWDFPWSCTRCSILKHPAH